MKKLYKSRTDKMISGVCGGVASYLKIDPLIVRVIWAVLAFIGAGIFAYIICIFIIPDEPLDTVTTTKDILSLEKKSNAIPTIVGAVLLVVGLSLLFGNFGLGWVTKYISKLFWPLFIVSIGALVIFGSTKKH